MIRKSEFGDVIDVYQLDVSEAWALAWAMILLAPRRIYVSAALSRDGIVGCPTFAVTQVICLDRVATNYVRRYVLCTGSICRSPYAEAVLNNVLAFLLNLPAISHGQHEAMRRGQWLEIAASTCRSIKRAGNVL